MKNLKTLLPILLINTERAEVSIAVNSYVGVIQDYYKNLQNNETVNTTVKTQFKDYLDIAVNLKTTLEEVSFKKYLPLMLNKTQKSIIAKSIDYVIALANNSRESALKSRKLNSAQKIAVINDKTNAINRLRKIQKRFA